LEELLKFPSEGVRKVANNIARRHWVFLASAPGEIKALHSLHDHEYGVSVAAIKKSTTLGRLRRLSSQQFWLSNLNRILDSEREKKARYNAWLGSLEKGKMPYCSDSTIEILKAREEEIIRRLARSRRKNLAAIYKHSTKSTFNKAYLQAKAMDIVANKRGMNWLFLTLTCPPEYHSNAQSFDGSSFDDGQCYLQKVFAQIGRALGNAGYKSGTDYLGIRVLEVHKDGTPHWHVLFYYTRDLDKVIEKKLSNIYSKEPNRPKNYLNDHYNEIFLRAQPQQDVSLGGATTPAISYLFKKLSYAFGLYAHSQSEDAIRHRYAIKAARARQIQTFGVTGHTTKIKALRKAYSNECLPENLMVLAAPLKMACGDSTRKDVQLQAMIGVLEGSLDHLKLLSVDTMNKYGESVPKVTHIKSKISHEITCIENMTNQEPDHNKEWKGGVNINDSSFSCGCVKCDQMLAASHGLSKNLAQSTPIGESNQQRAAQKTIEPSAPSPLPAIDDDSYVPWYRLGCYFCKGAFATVLQSTKAVLQAQFALLPRFGRIRLIAALVMYLSLIPILLALEIPTRNYLAHDDVQLSQPHCPLGMHPEHPMSPKQKTSRYLSSGDVRDPP
jgi:chorismate mutase